MHRVSLAIAAALVLAACGSSSDQPATTSTAQTATAAKAPKPTNAEPKGKLSQPEYRSIHAAYKLIAALGEAPNIARTIRVGSRACTKVTTQTELLAAVHADCVQTIRFFGKAGQMVTRKAECAQAAQAGDISCYAELFRSLGRSARLAAVRSGHVNRVLRKRGIGGPCANAIGTTKKKLDAARAVKRDGLAAAHALEARNAEALRRATDKLQVDLNGIDSGLSPAQAFRQLRTCR